LFLAPSFLAPISRMSQFVQQLVFLRSPCFPWSLCCREAIATAIPFHLCRDAHLAQDRVAACTRALSFNCTPRKSFCVVQRIKPPLQICFFLRHIRASCTLLPWTTVSHAPLPPPAYSLQPRFDVAGPFCRLMSVFLCLRDGLPLEEVQKSFFSSFPRAENSISRL